ncbi:esterase family protein [Corynebacterium sp. 153RC1]|uniref:alpha/beta hydrolase n=1 Tax=unclassified Corynebacterium TaxID=2624378 RepID=UPI00211C2BCC|nr:MULTISPECIES: alpha/beta hydrolase family protein [unclassified Corynebacterium]MCQ9352697.1 esterase family protein [Corynebacterium sp. 209RC1]MCQ9354881.1 esterase family protein [Corynebacterium sp. 1222RC1]MCQ9357066.1 esterase family protein [Corynebacterium sp. 122RC1]MCQ9359312.1 esterase family protein [Corynebacterium sp. 142RC1]MCQ9361534.1 esterase family protein [Corynebacterium sp. 153RC1]
MSFVASLKNLGKKVTATAAAVVTAGALVVAGTGEAAAANRDWLRPDATGTCDWDAAAYWVQRCDVWSDAMGRNIPVQIQPALNGGNAGLYLLDGARATNIANAWTVDARAHELYVNNNITLVMPVGGAGSFYANWAEPINAQGDLYMWDTFLSQELPAYLEGNFGVARNNNSVIGLSMGGTAAINLAANHPGQFRQAMSYSGYLNLSGYAMNAMLGLALLDIGGLSINSLYGTAVTPSRNQIDPMSNISRLNPGQDIYVSAASGLWGPGDAGYAIQDVISGSILEWISNASTRTWANAATGAGLNVTTNYPGSGLHNWVQWNYQLGQTHQRVLNVMNAW